MAWAEFVAVHIPTPATVSVQAYEGSGAYGDVFADPVEVGPCVVEQTRRLVRVQTQDASGTEQVSSTTVYCPPGTVCPPGSRITWAGRTYRVLARSDLSAHGLGLPEHVELNLE
ncbi:hypothetical protein [Salinispora arenicola]|uniref:hypothetical protein n=1 Tax=Salinispora arenicola TaxID=168697 RepID=UPI001698EC6D|nr:hypothetical protein [Salinispora arenicola]NIL56715.1 hypothetical protein [Salinispora arenicola]NIL64311.1 hypothetical protein [Salinispora arenicola]